jgi:hypothetical protein
MVDLKALALPSGRRRAASAGFSVHADVCVPAHDRTRQKLSFALALAVLAAAAFLAVDLPARRATHVEPVIASRETWNGD